MSQPNLKTLHDAYYQSREESGRLEEMEASAHRILEEVAKKGNWDSPAAQSKVADARTRLQLASARAKVLDAEERARENALKEAFDYQVEIWNEKVSAAFREKTEACIAANLSFWPGDAEGCRERFARENFWPPILHQIRYAHYQPLPPVTPRYDLCREVRNFISHVIRESKKLGWSTE
jgi:hypothetical protein